MTNRIPNQYLEVAILRYVSHFKIAQAILIDQDTTYAEAGVNEGQLKRNIRLLVIIVLPALCQTEARPHSAYRSIKAPSYRYESYRLGWVYGGRKLSHFG